MEMKPLSKRLILRAVPRDVSRMIIRLLPVPDELDRPHFHEAMRTVLDWEDDPKVHRSDPWPEFNGLRRQTPKPRSCRLSGSTAKGRSTTPQN